VLDLNNNVAEKKKRNFIRKENKIKGKKNKIILRYRSTPAPLN
jgi:hypothetical protein